MTKTTPIEKKSSANALAPLFHNRWSVPVLAELHRGRGAKFITLVKRLGVGRDTLSRTLKALDKRGWAVRNPGYGHPMRPEYILTEPGRALGPACPELMDALADQQEVGLKKWSMPVLFTLGSEPRRFNELAAGLSSATPRALTQALKDLVEVEFVERQLLDEYPPRTLYAATPAAAPLLGPLTALVAVLQPQQID